LEEEFAGACGTGLLAIYHPRVVESEVIKQTANMPSAKALAQKGRKGAEDAKGKKKQKGACFFVRYLVFYYHVRFGRSNAKTANFLCEF